MAAEAVAAITRAKNHYETLGVGRDAAEVAIRKAYRKLAILLHPDKNDTPEAKQCFIKVGEAMQELGDAQKRCFYDHRLSGRGGMPPGYRPPAPPAAPQPRPYPGGSARPTTSPVNVDCPHCKKRLNVNLDNSLFGRKVTLTCPLCKQTMGAIFHHPIFSRGPPPSGGGAPAAPSSSGAARTAAAPPPPAAAAAAAVEAAKQAAARKAEAEAKAKAERDRKAKLAAARAKKAKETRKRKRIEEKEERARAKAARKTAAVAELRWHARARARACARCPHPHAHGLTCILGRLRWTVCSQEPSAALDAEARAHVGGD